MRGMRSVVRLAFAYGTLCMVAACSTPQFSDATADSGLDVATDTIGPPHFEAGSDTSLSGRSCSRNEQCNDGIDCTDDRCGTAGRCVNIAAHDRCDDHLYCNGGERCDLMRGCVRGAGVDCSDNNTCTQDRCDETTHTCTHRPLDRDGDGDPDQHCMSAACADGGVEDDSGLPGTCWRGRDCDDRNARVATTLPETCNDMLDNNCDGRVDEMPCRAGPHDLCNDPLDISAGGAFTLSLAGLRRDYTVPCATPAAEAVARFVLSAPRDVTIVGSSRTALAMLALQSRCGGTASETSDCIFDFPATIRRLSLPAGEYFLLVGASSPTADVDLDVRFAPATPPPTNDTCATATRIPGAGTYRGSTIGLRDDYSLTCNPGGYADAVFEFTLTEPHDVTISTDSRDSSAAVALLSNCTAPIRPLRCMRSFGRAISFRSHSLPAGTYQIIVETGRRPDNFGLTLAIDPPTPTDVIDVCPAVEPDPAVDLNDGAMHVARMADLEDDYTLSCDSFRNARDAVFRLTLATPSDVRITGTATSGLTYASLRDAGRCVGPAERRCSPTAAGPGMADVDFTQRALPAGTYWLIIENTEGADVTVRAAITPPSPVVTYTGTESPPGITFVDVCAMAGAGRVLVTIDDSTVSIPMGTGPAIPFPLRMYGIDAPTTVAVSSNGWMSLTRTTTNALSGRIPAPAEPNLTIAPYWTDTYTRAAGVCYAAVGTAPNRSYIVQWQDLHYCCTDDPMIHMTFEVILHEAAAGANNIIDVVYSRMDGVITGRGAAAGIENDDGSDGVTIAMPFTAPRVVRFTPSR